MEALNIMAEKRMFSLSVVDTDWFLDLPLSTQALYFHLNMRADDDGFVDAPNSIVRKIGASKNDFDLLLAKRYILQFESGIIVIKHWRMHNTIQKDRYKPTQFQEELKTLSVKDNKAYTDCQPNGNQTETKCIQSVSNVYPKCIQPASADIDIDLDLDLDKNNNICSKKGSIEQLFGTFWSSYPNKIGKQKCLNWFKTHKPNEELVKKMVDTIGKFKKSKKWSDPQYIPYPYTWLNRGGWEDELEPEKESTFQSAPKNPIQWEEAKANTIEDDISLIKNNPDIAYKILDSIEKIHPERVEEIKRRLGM